MGLVLFIQQLKAKNSNLFICSSKDAFYAIIHFKEFPPPNILILIRILNELLKQIELD